MPYLFYENKSICLHWLPRDVLFHKYAAILDVYVNTLRNSPWYSAVCKLERSFIDDNGSNPNSKFCISSNMVSLSSEKFRIDTKTAICITKSATNAK